jgi:hypothetical protein
MKEKTPWNKGGIFLNWIILTNDSENVIHLNFQNIIRGMGTKKEHGIFTITGLMIFLGIIGLLTQLYDTPFTFRLVCISNLGNPNYNIMGWWLFTLDFIFGAIILLPHCLYVYRHFQTPNKIFGGIWLLLSLMGVFGLVMVGIFNETINPAHIIFALFSFGGIGLGLFVSLIIMGWKIYAHEPWPTKGQYFGFILVIIGFLAVILNELRKYGIDVPSDLNFTEWVAFILLMVYLIGLYLVIPNENKLK